MTVESDSVNYLSVTDILAIHELIVEADDDTETGVTSPGAVEYAVSTIREGHFGQVPESLDEKAFQLLRLLVANHPFVDGNKRTALMSVRILYALNGLDFAYDRRIKDILKTLATDEASVKRKAVLSYFDEHTGPLEPEYRATIDLWLSEIADAERIVDDLAPDRSEIEPNDYDSESHREG